VWVCDSAAEAATVLANTGLAHGIEMIAEEYVAFDRELAVLAARSPHRGDAYAACRYAIERIKQIAPIWKREFFEGGDVWIEGAVADPRDEKVRAEAERIACA